MRESLGVLVSCIYCCQQRTPPQHFGPPYTRLCGNRAVDCGCAMGELIAPISPAGLWLETAPLPIDLAHRNAALHKGVWLFIVSADDELLIAQRNAAMATCPGTLTVIGEHHNGRESDAACARRALREELPGLYSLSSSLYPLRPQPRWFLYDYPPLADGIARRDRCLISEFVVELRANASEALARVKARGAPEAAAVTFQSIPDVRRMLRRRPERFCARELYPSCLCAPSPIYAYTRVAHARGDLLVGRVPPSLL